jgi:transglutaminase-like putative cysteine protease
MKEEILEDIEEEKKESWHKGPIRYVLSIFLLLLIIMMVVPFYSVRLDPEPKNIVGLEEINKFVTADPNMTVKGLEEVNKVYNKNNPQIKFVADKIAASSCEENRVCYAKALYYFIRDNIKYVSDPNEMEYIESPEIVLKTGAADCESGSLLLLNMMESIGIDGQVVLIPGHAFIRIKLDGAIGKYKNDGWIYLDWTCGNCKFGEVPYGNIKENMGVLDI